MDFQRARSDVQRNERRRVILETAATMLSEGPVAQLSLNELSRRVGLAKSNVLRYFESREAILLELLNAELQRWAEAVSFDAGNRTGEFSDRVATMATELASTLDRRPVLCDLMSAQSSVLERNVSSTVALQHKIGVAESVSSIVDKIMVLTPELDGDEAYELMAATLIFASAMWPQSHPSEAVRAVYRDHPDIAARQMTFLDGTRRSIESVALGIHARRQSREFQ